MDLPNKYIVWDLETSGLDARADKILEVGAMLVQDGEITWKNSWLIKHPDFQPSEKITEITGITPELLEKEGLDRDYVMDQFMELLDNHIESDRIYNLTHNGYRFDLPFLFNAFTPEQLEKYRKPLTIGCMDSAVLYKARELGIARGAEESFVHFAARVMSIRKFGLKYNVAHCCNVLGIDTSTATFHRALGDVMLTNEIYKKLV